MDARRNDPCPCGSGLKYKQCCINQQAWYENSKVWGGGAVLVLLLAGLLIAFSAITSEETAGPPYERPEGEAPPGKVWSPQHGHWHDSQ